jgi:flagellar L-ring protein precursor FlgH
MRRTIVGVLLLLTLSDAAIAQSNSLFRRPGQPAGGRPGQPPVIPPPNANVVRGNANLALRPNRAAQPPTLPGAPLPAQAQGQGQIVAPLPPGTVSAQGFERPQFAPPGAQAYPPANAPQGYPQYSPQAVGFPGMPANPAGPAVRQIPAAVLDPQLNPNPALLAVSPIAVPAPQKDKIQPGALIQIVVREVKQAMSDAQLRSDKKWELDAALNQWFRLGKRGNWTQQEFKAGQPAIDLELDDKYEGRGRVDRRDELTTRITATVIDVKPNGTLVLEARKSIELDEETQVYTLTGKCRAEDLTPQNTILSTQVADLELSVQHTGAARDAARRGIWKRLSDLFRLS